MIDSGKHESDAEIERLSQALDAETQRRLVLRAELDRSEAEFEEFISTAAHDLRESLRDVAAFSQLLGEANAGRQSDPDSGVFLDRIREGAARMESLLADVVDYWSIGMHSGQCVPTNLETVLDQALARAEKQSAIVTHDPLPYVIGDFSLLIKVLHHLISNAIEYCGRPDPSVHISSELRDLEWIISVQDNGPGIDPAFQERIFGAFKRLHGKELPGHGLGLAFCRKAIERLGGRLWLESTAGSGSTFYFTLPCGGNGCEAQLP